MVDINVPDRIIRRIWAKLQKEGKQETIFAALMAYVEQQERSPIGDDDPDPYEVA